jgi:hypothetical protein
MFRKKNQYCRICGKITIHVKVRNLDIFYWRCENCLENALQKGKIFIPPYVACRPRWIDFEDLSLLKQFRMFQSKDSRF